VLLSLLAVAFTAITEEAVLTSLLDEFAPSVALMSLLDAFAPSAEDGTAELFTADPFTSDTFAVPFISEAFVMSCTEPPTSSNEVADAVALLF